MSFEHFPAGMAAALDAVSILQLAPVEETHDMMILLARLTAMLTKLAGLSRR